MVFGMMKMRNKTYSYDSAQLSYGTRTFDHCGYGSSLSSEACCGSSCTLEYFARGELSKAVRTGGGGEGNGKGCENACRMLALHCRIVCRRAARVRTTAAPLTCACSRRSPTAAAVKAPCVAACGAAMADCTTRCAAASQCRPLAALAFDWSVRVGGACGPPCTDNLSKAICWVVSDRYSSAVSLIPSHPLVNYIIFNFQVFITHNLSNIQNNKSYFVIQSLVVVNVLVQ